MRDTTPMFNRAGEHCSHYRVQRILWPVANPGNALTFPLPAHLPRPVDDGATSHLVGIAMPDIALAPLRVGWLTFQN